MLKASFRAQNSLCICAPCQEREGTGQSGGDCAPGDSLITVIAPCPPPPLTVPALLLTASKSSPAVALTAPSTAHHSPSHWPLRSSLWVPITQTATSSRTLKPRTSRLSQRLEQRVRSRRGWGGGAPARERVSGGGLSRAHLVGASRGAEVSGSTAQVGGETMGFDPSVSALHTHAFAHWHPHAHMPHAHMLTPTSACNIPAHDTDSHIIGV